MRFNHKTYHLIMQGESITLLCLCPSGEYLLSSLLVKQSGKTEYTKLILLCNIVKCGKKKGSKGNGD